MKWRIGYGTMGLIAITLAAGLVWYNIKNAPTYIPVDLAFSEVPTLNAYPELEGVKINPNTATEEELQQLPGVGPARATAIKEYIAAYGKLSNAEQMLEIEGIGESILEGMRPYLVFG